MSKWRSFRQLAMVCLALGASWSCTPADVDDAAADIGDPRTARRAVEAAGEVVHARVDVDARVTGSGSVSVNGAGVGVVDVCRRTGPAGAERQADHRQLTKRPPLAHGAGVGAGGPRSVKVRA